MENYPLEKELVWAGVSPSANEIWKWGIKNKKGVLRSQPEDKLRFYLLRHANASITEKGIKYRKMLYTCNLAKEENWFSRLNDNVKVEIAYDSDCMNTIMIYNNSTKKYIECEINRQMTVNDVYINRSLYEIESYDNSVSVKKETVYRDANDELFAEKRERRNEIVEEAIKKSEGSQIKVEDIDENRSIEKILYDGQKSLVKNPYLVTKHIEENVCKHEDAEIDNDINVVNASTSSRNVLADFIRNKTVNGN